MTAAPASGPAAALPGRSIAIVGLACRFPDANDPAALLDVILTGRRAFRRIPRGRLDLADYYSPDPSAPDATYSTRAALLEGWWFDAGAFGVSATARASADPAHWLALETTARALAAAGFAGGAGLPGATAGAYIGSGMSGDASPAAALRLRWPYARRVIADALAAATVPADVAGQVLDAAAARYLAPFPPVTADTLAGSTPAAIAGGICAQFGLRGGGVTVDAAGASAMAAIATACQALAAGELDAAVAGGVDLCIDPIDLVGLAKSGVLAIGEMRIYDEHPTGFLPGEGCGIVLLMRSADARAASLPTYAEIVGWGMAAGGNGGSSPPAPARSAGGPRRSEPDLGGQLLAMRRAYAMAAVDPADVQLVEGCGTGVPAYDLAELAALADLRAGSRRLAALGSISANIGNTRAAAGAAGLIKAVLAIANGVLPPSTGIRTPHGMLRDGRAALSLPAVPQSWPAGVRHAGVSAAGPEELAVHLVLRGEDGRTAATAGSPQPRARSLPRAVQTRPATPARSRRPASVRSKAATRAQNLTEPALRLAVTRSSGTYARSPEQQFAYLLTAPDRTAMIAALTRLAAIAPWLSDAQLQDLAVTLSQAAGPAGQAVRIALTAAGQDELAGLASEAMRLLPGLSGTAIGTRPGIYADQGPGGGTGALADGDVALVITGQPDDLPDLPQRQLSRMLAVLRWLDELGVAAGAAVGHGIGELAGLVWAGAATPADARTLTALRSAALAAPPGSAPGQLGSTIGRFSSFAFRPARRRLISGSTGRDVTEPAAIAEVLCAELFEARLAAAGEGSASRTAGESALATAIAAASASARLLITTGTGQHLAAAIAALGAPDGRPGAGSARMAVSIEGDPADDGSVAHSAAALFAAGALPRPEALYAGRPSRPFDIWREQVFLTHPCEAPTPAPTGPPAPPGQCAEPAETRPEPAKERTAFQATARGSAADAGSPVAGVGRWVRCYVERTQPAAPVPADDDQPWRIHAGGCEPLDQSVNEIFRHDPAASRTLALIGGLDNADAREAAVLAARDAAGTGTLVAISEGPGPAGLWASLRAEHPSVGITAIMAPLTAAGLSAARGVAAARPGVYRELSIGLDGALAEPVLAVLPAPGGGEFPLGPADVVMISRGSGAAGLVLAQVIACSGAAIVVIGRDHPEHDDAVIAGLEELRGAGAKIGYEIVDLADHAVLTAAVRRVEARFGRVTAIGHAAGAVPKRALAELTPARADEQVRRHIGPLDQLAAAVRTAARGSSGRQGQPRLIVTSGSVIGRYGMAGEAAGALVTGALADFAQRLAAASPGCRALHVDWPAWSEGGMGERADLAERMTAAGYAPIPVAEGSRQLLKLLATDGLPARVAVHGRVGVPAPRPIAAAVPEPAGGPGVLAADRAPKRFVEHLLVHYPGVELVAEARLSLLADPYLGDYRVDGVPVLPPGMALEAMAQVASALSGTPARRAAGVAMSAPIVLPAGTPGSQTVIRLAAVRDGDAVTVVVRSDNSGFAVEHCRAVFAMPDRPDATPPASQIAGLIAGEAAGLSEPAEAGGSGTELYGHVLFQTGRFRRLATVRLGDLGGTGGPSDLPGSRAGIGLADGADDQPWFGAVPPARAAARQRLLLGSAGLTDATLQLVQACVAHRRLAFAGCDEVSFAGREADGLVTIRAIRRGQAQQVPRPRPPAGRDAGGTSGPSDRASTEHQDDEEARWDVDATDSAEQLLIAWRGLRMRDAGPLPQRAESSASGTTAELAAAAPEQG